MEANIPDEIVYTTDDGTVIEGVGTPSYVDPALGEDDEEPPPYRMSEQEESLLAAIGAINDRLFEIVKTRVPDIMRNHGEDPGNKYLLGLRMAQAVYGLDHKARRVAGL